MESGSKAEPNPSSPVDSCHRWIGLLPCRGGCTWLSCSRACACDSQFQHFRGLAHDAITPQKPRL